MLTVSFSECKVVIKIFTSLIDIKDAQKLLIYTFLKIFFNFDSEDTF